MRLEIIIPDNTRPDLKRKLTGLTQRLSANPELVDELLADNVEPLPDYLGIMDQALASPNRFNSGAEVDAYISGMRADWCSPFA